MLIEPEPNPFTILYDGLWNLFKRNRRLNLFIEPGNRRDFTDNSDFKDDVSDADFPELSLQSESTFAQLKLNSSSTLVRRTYAIVLVTGSLDLAQIFDQISWEILRSIVDYDKYICNLEWEGNPFSINLRMLESSEGTAFSEENRLIKGWAMTWPFQVDMNLLTNSLRLPDEYE